MTPNLFFDLDGTITDPREGFVRSIAHALGASGRPVPPEAALERLIGPPLARSVEKLLGTTDEAVVARVIEAYRERYRTIGILENRVYPEIPPALSLLAERGFALFLVTSKPTVFARRILDHFALSAYFTQIYGPALDDHAFDKASLVGRALAGERLRADRAVMIGDRKEDVEGAKAHGVRSIGVGWGFGSREELERAGADHVVDSVAELLARLTGG